MIEEREDDRTFAVVVNEEEQYSVWLADREPPIGWRTIGIVGSRADCLAQISEIWTDMRPRSLRVRMDANSQAAAR